MKNWKSMRLIYYAIRSAQPKWKREKTRKRNNNWHEKKEVSRCAECRKESHDMRDREIIEREVGRCSNALFLVVACYFVIPVHDRDEKTIAKWRGFLSTSDLVAIAIIVISILLGHGDVGGLGVGLHLLVLGIGIKSASSKNQNDADETSRSDDVVEGIVSKKSLKANNK